jgi:hypothetical protein
MITETQRSQLRQIVRRWVVKNRICEMSSYDITEDDLVTSVVTLILSQHISLQIEAHEGGVSTLTFGLTDAGHRLLNVLDAKYPDPFMEVRKWLH